MGRTRLRRFWPLLLVFLLLAAAFGIARTRSEPDVGQVLVPTVVDLSVAEARRRLTAEGLRSAVARRASAGPPGRVLDQAPSGGSRLDTTEAVLLVVSIPLPVVPRLVGLSLPLAAKRLRGAGLKLRFRAVASNLDAGVVVATDPSSGESVDSGATVTVSVSEGPGRIAVPNLLWRRAAAARASVREAGLVARVFEVPSQEPAGTVVAQSPQPGAELNRGSRVRVDVSAGSASPEAPVLSRTVAVPSVVGLPLATAEDRLRARGLIVRIEYVTAAEPLGQVLKQDLPAATAVRRGENVRIAVSAGPAPSDLLEVIALIGLLEDGATSAVETAGFLPRALRERTPDPAEVGIVVRQEPEAFRQAPQGGQITIYVGVASG